MTSDTKFGLLCGHCGKLVWQHPLAQIRQCAIDGSTAIRAEERKQRVERLLAHNLAAGHAITKEEVEASLAEHWQKEDEDEARERAEREKFLEDCRRKARESLKS